MNKRDIVNARELSKLFDCSVYELNKLSQEANKTKYDFKISRGKYDKDRAVKFIVHKLKNESKNKYILGIKDIAFILGYNEKYINELELRHGLPREDRNQYDIIKVIRWFVPYLKSISENRELEKQAIRLKKIQSDKLEMEFKRESGLLMERDIHIQILSQVFSNIKNKMLGSPNRIAHQVFSSENLNEAKTRTRNIIDEVLNELSDPKLLFEGRIHSSNGKN